MAEPKLITGGLSIDDRGEVGFINDFDFLGVKRFYSLSNHKKGFIRAWHAHKNEAKHFYMVKGAALICAVEIDNWDNPSKDLKIHRFVLSEKSPSILFVPKGYANGFMSLNDEAKIIVFSSSSLKDSMSDDYRFDARYWNPWHIEER
jgi:dTDP-4-dehydrorhamnose 3,5-epimerase-like enzyme